MANSLFIVIIAFVTDHVEELQGIFALLRAHNPQPVAQLLLLEELLGQVLYVPAAEVLVRHDLNLAIAEVRHGDAVAEVAGPAFDLDSLLQKQGKRGRVEDAVGRGLAGVDDVLLHESD